MDKTHFLTLVNAAETEYTESIAALDRIESGAMPEGFEHINIKTMRELCKGVNVEIADVVNYLIPGLPAGVFKGKSDRGPRMNCVIVPLNSNNGHNYRVGEPIMVTDPESMQSCIRMDFSRGNTMDADPANWRFATPEEKERFADAVSPRLSVAVSLG